MKDNQHWIPQHYLKGFTAATRFVHRLDLTNLEKIGLTHGPWRKFKQYNSIAGICCENNYYGPEVDQQIKPVECSLFPKITKVRESGQIGNDLEDLWVMRVYTMFMHFRNPQTINHTRTLATTRMQEGLIEIAKLIPEALPQAEVAFRTKELYAAQEVCMSVFEESADYISDLKIKLLEAPLDTNFITSDRPVLPTNQALQEKYKGSIRGMAIVGSQIFFPISSRYCLFFYDSGAYRVRRHDQPNTILISPEDVRALNRMQFLNAAGMVLYESASSDPEIASLVIHNLNERAKLKKEGDIPTYNHAYKVRHPKLKRVTVPHSLSFCKKKPLQHEDKIVLRCNTQRLNLLNKISHK